MNYKVTFPFLWETIDPLDDNIDVIIQMENGKCFTVVVATPRNVSTLMIKEGLPYLLPGAPLLFVEELTEANVLALLASLVRENSELLGLYGEDRS